MNNNRAGSVPVIRPSVLHSVTFSFQSCYRVAVAGLGTVRDRGAVDYPYVSHPIVPSGRSSRGGVFHPYVFHRCARARQIGVRKVASDGFTDMRSTAYINTDFFLSGDMVSAIVGPDEIRPWVELLIMLAIVAGVLEAVRRVIPMILETFAGLR